jgi:hypothetical protein
MRNNIFFMKLCLKYYTIYIQLLLYDEYQHEVIKIDFTFSY